MRMLNNTVKIVLKPTNFYHGNQDKMVYRVVFGKVSLEQSVYKCFFSKAEFTVLWWHFKLNQLSDPEALVVDFPGGTA